MSIKCLSQRLPQNKRILGSLSTISPTITFTTVCDSKHFICHHMGLITFCLSLNKLNILSPSLDWEHKQYVSHLCISIDKKAKQNSGLYTQMLKKYSLKWIELLNFLNMNTLSFLLLLTLNLLNLLYNTEYLKENIQVTVN